MEETTLKIECHKLNNSGGWDKYVMTALDGLVCGGVYNIRAFNDDGSWGLPFILAHNDAVKVVVKEQPQRTEDTTDAIKVVQQTATYVDRVTGNVLTYTRTRRKVDGAYIWDKWEQLPVETLNRVTWSNSGTLSNMNEFVTAGMYDITGERTRSNDNLPIANTGGGHTFHARLLVIDSSINAQEVCITQVLMLGNRVGGDGNVYVRTGNATSKVALQAHDSTAWKVWGKLQSNVEVGVVASLDAFIDNGMYSGVLSAGRYGYETFVLVTINNYAIAKQIGHTRYISQFKYALNIDGTFSYRSRVGEGNDTIEWSEWVDITAASTADIQPNSVTADKLASEVREKINNPLRPLFIAAGAEYNDTGADTTKTAPWGETVTHKVGHYYLNGLGDITEEQMMDIYNVGKINSIDLIGRFCATNIRTNLPTFLNFCGAEGYGNFSLAACCNNAKKLQVIIFTHNISVLYASNSFYGAFSNCNVIEYIYPAIDVKNCVNSSQLNAFYYCLKLKHVELKNIKMNLNFAYSCLISKESIIYAVKNAQPTDSITVTLHPDAYARLADDADIVAALEAQPLVSLVSA